MWFLFGFVTLGVACLSALAWRWKISWRGQVDDSLGIPYEYRLSVYERSVWRIRVGVACGRGFSFTLKPEGGLDRWSKAIGLVRECQSGDAAFDAAVYVASDDAVFHRMLQTDAALRSNIERVVRTGSATGKVSAIHAEKGRIWVEIEPDAGHRATSRAQDAARDIAPALIHLAADFRERPQDAARPPDRFFVRAAALLAISSGLAINGLFELARLSQSGDVPFMTDRLAPLPWAIAIGLIGAFGLAVLAVRFLGRSSRTHLVLIELLLVGSFGIATSAFAGLRDYNMEFDRAPAAIQKATITDRYDIYHKHRRRRVTSTTRTCHLGMLGWPSVTVSQVRSVSCGFYDRVMVGMSVDVRLREGALGWSWIENFVAHTSGGSDPSASP